MYQTRSKTIAVLALVLFQFQMVGIDVAHQSRSLTSQNKGETVPCFFHIVHMQNLCQLFRCGSSCGIFPCQLNSLRAIITDCSQRSIITDDNQLLFTRFGFQLIFWHCSMRSWVLK